MNLILAIIVTTSHPTPRDNPIVQAQTIGKFIPTIIEPPKPPTPTGTGTR